MDIDIDFKTDFTPDDYFDNIVHASIVNNGKITKHPAGIYFQNMAKDRISDLAAIPYKEAEKEGYFKIDFLHISVLDYFESKEEIRKLIQIEPDWMLLESADVVSKLSHIHRYYDLVNKIKPTSVIQVADILALIRPSKKYLIDAYVQEPDLVRKELYTKPDDGGYYFKKPHSISYSLNIVLQLHLIKGKII